MATYKDAYEKALKYFNGDDLAADVFLSKYALSTPKGDILEETPDAMHRRLAKEFARIEANYPNALSEKEIFKLLDKFKHVVLQGSPMAGIGNPYQIMSLGNCFVVDSPWDSFGGICKTDQELAQLFKRRCGVGVNISTIRPAGMTTSNAAKTTDGIGVFMERFSNTCREVATKGRRGALMITLSVHHPDIFTFMSIKQDRTKVTGANLSIMLTDDFMNAVQNDAEYELKWPVDSVEPKFSKMVPAREVWNTIIQNAWEHAEPGVLFWDTILRRSPADCYSEFKTICSNPCLTSDTWIFTSEGPRQISNLIGKPFQALVNGKRHDCFTGFFHTGNKAVYKVCTKEGFELKGTGNHKLLTSTGWKRIDRLEIGDILINQHHEQVEWPGSGTFEEGWLLGEMVGDGCYNPECYYGQVAFWGSARHELAQRASSYVEKLPYRFRSDFAGGISNNTKYNKSVVSSKALDQLAKTYLEPKTKNLLPAVELASSDFYRGFIRGLFDSDGSVQGNLEKGVSVRLAQNNLERLKIIQRMLLKLGIWSHLYACRKPNGKSLLPDGKGGSQFYHTKAMHELVVSKDQIEIFAERIGFFDTSKREKLANITETRKRTAYKTQWQCQVKTVELLGAEDVYDCTIDEIHQFDANGLTAHNCSEILLSKDDSCRLVVINALGFVGKPFTTHASFDFELFGQITRKAQRLMDDLVDLELECIDKILQKIKSDPEPDYIKHVELELWKRIRNVCHRGRRTGLGLTGIADALAAVGIQYGSNASIEMVEQIYQHLALNSYRESVNLAKERGTFPAYAYEAEKDHQHINQIMDLDPQLRDMWEKHGRRNIAINTTAPCGSVSILTQTSSGIEPVFSISYTRRKKLIDNGGETEPDFIDSKGDRWQEYTVFHPQYYVWEKTKKSTTVEDSPYWNATANDIDWKASVSIQAAAQKWVDHAISKTVNLPADASTETVQMLYEMAWKLGCKGLTVYRDGSRDGVLITDKRKPACELHENHAPRRPEFLECDIYHLQVHGEKWNAFVGLLNEKPYEIFAGRAKYICLPRNRREGKIRKNGTYNLYCGEGDNELMIEDLATIFENPTESAFTRTVSLALRHGTPIQFVVEQIVKGSDKESDMFSLSRGLARVLKNYIKDGTKPTEKSCHNCQSGELAYEEGCITCKACGWSKCS